MAFGVFDGIYCCSYRLSITWSNIGGLELNKSLAANVISDRGSLWLVCTVEASEGLVYRVIGVFGLRGRVGARCSIQVFQEKNLGSSSGFYSSVRTG